jgi:hypothetical protein
MDEATFSSSAPGRIAAVGFGIAVAGAGAMAIVGPGEHGLVAVPAVLLVCVTAGILSIGLSIGPFPRAALAMVLGLPFGAGFYFFALSQAADAGRGPGSVLCIAGILLIALAAAGHLLQRPSRANRLSPALKSQSGQGETFWPE